MKQAGQLVILEPFENTMGLAKTIQCKCCTDKTHTFHLHEPETTSHDTKKMQHEAAKWYAINVKFVYIMHIFGYNNVDTCMIFHPSDLLNVFFAHPCQGKYIIPKILPVSTLLHPRICMM